MQKKLILFVFFYPINCILLYHRNTSLCEMVVRLAGRGYVL